MISTRIVLLSALLAAAAVALGQGQQPQRRPQNGLPPGHPPMLPADHPPLTGQGGPAPAPAEARPEDVASADAVVAAYYETISGPAGTAREWGRFQSLFLPGARMVSTTSGPGGGSPIVVTPEMFARMNSRYFESSGYREQPVRESSERFGNIVQVWSTYEARRGGEDAPYSRGINGFQLLHTQGRWWIVAMIWDRERPGTELAPEHLP